MTAQLSLPVCPLAGCNTVVADPGRPCDGCLSDLDGWLRESDRPAPDPVEVEERDARYRQVMTDRARLIAETEAAATRQMSIDAGELRKPGQTCWICEERRACKLIAGLWECIDCEAII